MQEDGPKNFKTKTDIPQNLINTFFSMTVRGPFHRKDFK